MHSMIVKPGTDNDRYHAATPHQIRVKYPSPSDKTHGVLNTDNALRFDEHFVLARFGSRCGCRISVEGRPLRGSEME